MQYLNFRELNIQNPMHKFPLRPPSPSLPPAPHDVAALLCMNALCYVQELDSQDPMHKEFWDALMVIAEVELQEAVKQDELDWARLRGESIPAKYTVKEAGLHEAVDSDVQMMLAGGTS